MNQQRLPISLKGIFSGAIFYCTTGVLCLILLTWLTNAWQNDQRTVYAANSSLDVNVFISGLSTPWDMAFTPDGTMLVNQRSGGIKARHSDGSVTTVGADFSDLKAVGEGGLMGMVIDPDFEDNRRFYTCQGHKNPLEIQVVSWTINNDYSQATRVDDPLIGDIPMNSNGRHSGCRLRFGSDGYLYISTGDAASSTAPQDLTSLGGKVLRVDAQTGQGAPGNPYINSDTANSKLIYSYGHRNPQGLALRPGSSQMWVIEHGPHVDDEINLLEKGGNYGWNPVQANSQSNSYYEYVPMTDTDKYPDAVEARWSSGISTYATAGGIFLEGDHWDDKEGWLAVATLKNSTLYLFDLNSAGEYQSVSIPPELKRTYNRLRSALIGPDQALYIASSNAVLRVAPATPAEESPADTTPPTIVVDQTETQLLASTDSGDVDQASWRNLPTTDNQCDQNSFDGHFDQSPVVDLSQLAPGDYAYCFAVKDINNNWDYEIFEFQITLPVVVDEDQPQVETVVVDEDQSEVPDQVKEVATNNSPAKTPTSNPADDSSSVAPVNAELETAPDPPSDNTNDQQNQQLTDPDPNPDQVNPGPIDSQVGEVDGSDPTDIPQSGQPTEGSVKAEEADIPQSRQPTEDPVKAEEEPTTDRTLLPIILVLIVAAIAGAVGWLILKGKTGGRAG